MNLFLALTLMCVSFVLGVAVMCWIKAGHDADKCSECWQQLKELTKEKRL